jgi:hypothetical protein
MKPQPKNTLALAKNKVVFKEQRITATLLKNKEYGQKIQQNA